MKIQLRMRKSALISPEFVKKCPKGDILKNNPPPRFILFFENPAEKHFFTWPMVY